MGIVGNSFRAELLELKSQVTAASHNHMRRVQDLWEDRVRIDEATVKPPAPRESWRSRVRESGRGVYEAILSWDDFKGSREAAERRFIKAAARFDEYASSMLRPRFRLGGR